MDTEVVTGTAGKRDELVRRSEQARRAGSPQAIARQHAKGKLTARERIDLLLDDGSFVEIGQLARHRCHEFGMENNRPYGDGVVTGHGTIDGRTVCVFAQDFTVFGGTLGEVYGEKIVKLMDLAGSIGCPLIGLNDSGGARIQEGVASLAQYAEIFRRNVALSGVVPQISVQLGPCAGGAAYSPAATDFVIMVDGLSHMFVTGPEVIKSITGEDTDPEVLGGARTHNEITGNAHYLATDEEDAFDYVRILLGHLPSNNHADPPVYAPSRAETPAEREWLETAVPDADNRPYDMLAIIQRVVDDGELLEIAPIHARNIICGFARLDGTSVGVVANQPLHAGGALDIAASEKAARFIRFCDAFGIPVVTFVDVPGFTPGAEQEHGGIIRRGAKLGYAYAEAGVPMVTVVVRKAYGGGYGVMGSKHLGIDVNLAWPTAQIAVMGASAAAEVMHRKQLLASDDPATLKKQLVATYEETLCNPYVAADRGYVDAVIEPSRTREEIVRRLGVLRTKRRPTTGKWHGNIPL
ncbi:Propionyl-CoA carboxylase beta chain [Streptomyces davaonensis JCM 4913]|uniref:Propionyl-CoA carboxylase beta chain n=1 Tax=Streptomyces davaonensis (strain DSM 101723 / JCM 4913 / KCC S-0913 / 768) TaxID=1214101 RepID=K4R097_STRDJ|nr:acyl-CoA carboxylase subunit beta [Streptomyces davaonensis]CCK26515.1 Propionyl-CoA carboxylase beta chain [Streptomyces davaonensis JCM 4913]